jgi:hypothetical protein
VSEPSPAPTAYAARYPYIPYIVAWSAEEPLHGAVTTDRRGRIAYTDEVIVDRDRRGVLWTRVSMRQGQGVPQLGRVHPLRQRLVMRELRCQVCGGPADSNEQGTLWLLSDQQAGEWPNWPEDTGAAHPPVCVPCASWSVRACPHLRRGAVAVRVRDAPITGAYGALYNPGAGPGAAPVGDARLSYSDPQVQYLIASQLVRKLQGCTIIPPP